MDDQLRYANTKNYHLGTLRIYKKMENLSKQIMTK